MLATTLQTDFAATNPINNTTAGGISGALNSSSPGDIIELDEGTYSGNNNTNMTITKNVTIHGKTKDKVILDAQGLSRIFVINNNLNVTFINITFTNAYTTSNGGGIYNNYVNTTMKFIDCIFKGNNALIHGGGIYSLGDITISGSNFIDNTANNSGGGAYTLFGSINLSDSNFTYNTAGHDGGGIIINSNNYAFITNSNFVDNIASASGGGLSFMMQPNVFNSFLNIINSTFKNNTAAVGGAIYLRSAIDNSCLYANISGSNFESNTAIRMGGGLYVSAGPILAIGNNTHVNLTLENSIFIGNKAINGGGIVLSKGNTSSVDATLVSNIMGSNFTDNEATNDGGGIFIDLGAEITIGDCTIVNNYAGGDGGAIALKANDSEVTLTISDSEITNNTAGNNGSCCKRTTHHADLC